MPAVLIDKLCYTFGIGSWHLTIKFCSKLTFLKEGFCQEMSSKLRTCLVGWQGLINLDSVEPHPWCANGQAEFCVWSRNSHSWQRGCLIEYNPPFYSRYSNPKPFVVFGTGIAEFSFDGDKEGSLAKIKGSPSLLPIIQNDLQFDPGGRHRSIVGTHSNTREIS